MEDERKVKEVMVKVMLEVEVVVEKVVL